MRSHVHKQSSLFGCTNIEDRIAANSPLLIIKLPADMGSHSMSPTFDSLFAEGGRPSIAPERLLRVLLLEYLFSIRSERRLIKHLDFNMLFRCFVGLLMDEPVWDYSSFLAIRDRLLDESAMQEFFGGLVSAAEWAELASDGHFSVDGSLLRARASHRGLAARDGSDEGASPGPGAHPRGGFPRQEAHEKDPRLSHLSGSPPGHQEHGLCPSERHYSYAQREPPRPDRRCAWHARSMLRRLDRIWGEVLLKFANRFGVAICWLSPS
ncbi:transposase [Zoogloea sp.]|uniref:transposase n=1 Tax=Zoogloea sp. TaxID=49181 RepID=UPI001AC517C9|nr:transposase [Zoogloea sp.]MBN8282117.1 transposase [Zoogloea sp.]